MRRHERGVVLLVVLFFSLLLTSSIATFMRRATMDTMVARNREAVSRAEAVARGGVRLATALLVLDRNQEEVEGVRRDTQRDAWAPLRYSEVVTPDGASLRVLVEDTSSRLNLNALFNPVDGTARSQTEPFLEALLGKVIDEMQVPAQDKLYDPAELAENLIDWVDADELRQRGGPEDAYYQEQELPYRAANAPLMSVDQLRMVEGFDDALVEALRPYVTVYPFVLGKGVNVNTAPPHVLALLFFDDGVDLRMAGEDEVRAILKIHEDGGIVCDSGDSGEDCTPIRQIVQNAIFPEPSFFSDTFRVVAEARVGDVTRSVEAIVDRGPEVPEILAWRVR